MKKQEPATDNWIRIGVLVKALMGQADDATKDIILRHAKERTPEGDKAGPNGLDSIPPEYLKRSVKDGRGPRFMFLNSPEARIFFQNLLDLESGLGPKLTSDILRGKYRNNSSELTSELALRRKELEPRAAAYSDWLRNWPTLQAQLLDPKVDLRTRPLLQEVGTAASDARSQTDKVAKSLSLHIVRQLEELDRTNGRGLNGVSLLATKALHVLQLGELALAEELAQKAVEADPDHALANYAWAMVHLAHAAQAKKEESQFAAMRSEVDIQHESHWENMGNRAGDDARGRERKALHRLGHALKNWPITRWKGGQGWSDHQRRDHLLAVIVPLAFQFVHDYGNVDLDMLNNLRDRRAGQAIEAYFAADLDATLVAAGRDVERYTPTRIRMGRFQLKTLLLQLYFALSPDDYKRFVPEWLKEFTQNPPRTVEAVLEPGWHDSEIWANVVREHLVRVLPIGDIVTLMGQVEATSLEATRSYHAKVLKFLTHVPTDDDVDGVFDGF